VICPNHNGPLCTTCRLGGLIRCPVLGVPLPLVEGERPSVIVKPTIIYPPLSMKYGKKA
jgi:hypothetical protein